MSTDLEQFYEVFFEESSELLAEMEACLLGLDVNSPNIEDLNAIFRAAHSIKGGAGTFGFTDMTEMTHMLETLLDRLRKGELMVRSEMIDAFLRAGDVIKDQLAGHRGDGAADPIVVKEVCDDLQKFSEESSDAVIIDNRKDISSVVCLQAQEESSVAVETPLVEERLAGVMDEDTPPPVLENVNQVVYQIEFSTTGLSNGSKDNLFFNLRQQGKVEVLTQSSGNEVCLLRLTTSMPEEDIWETLAFVVNPANLKIEKWTETEGFQDPSVYVSVAIDGAENLESIKEPKISSAKGPDNAQYGFFPGAPAAPPIENNDHPLSELTQSVNSTDQTNLVANSNLNAKAASSVETNSIRVSIGKVDQMINLVGELVITQAMLAQTTSEIDPVISEKLQGGMSQLERNTRDLQEAVMSIRMLPMSFVFSRYPRVVRDLAAKLNKKVELKTVGEGTELDKGLIEKIADPLTHLVRNSLDHGIELPEKRIAAGKLAKGTITLRAFQQGGSIVIEVGDDGAGLNREKILAKARERGLQVHDGMSDQEVWMLIFEPGFSTADRVTDVSGRGVGMDVVKRNIQSMGGRVEVNSVSGVGTRITIRLPLTLAILDGLSVTVGDQMFIVPLTYITESLQPSDNDIRTISGRGRVVQVRGEYLPVIALHEVFNIRPKSTEIKDGILVILDADGHKAAMLIDELVGQHQVVIKSLESNYRRVHGVSGATIMGDGKVALILDTTGLVMLTQ
ncbi:MAG: chemotaxis protein CheW [Nitrosomonas sp.]|nr:chemotaxis protein CheW [Nitrosomonas sp.]